MSKAGGKVKIQMVLKTFLLTMSFLGTSMVLLALYAGITSRLSFWVESLLPSELRSSVQYFAGPYIGVSSMVYLNLTHVVMIGLTSSLLVVIIQVDSAMVSFIIALEKMLKVDAALLNEANRETYDVVVQSSGSSRLRFR